MLPGKHKSCFQFFQADGQVHLYRKLYEAMDPISQQGVMQADGQPVMVWDVLYWSSQGP